MTATMGTSLWFIKKNGLKQMFTQSREGLFYSVARMVRNKVRTERPDLTTNRTIIKHTTLNTVAKNKAKYTKREVRQANLARKIQKSI